MNYVCMNVYATIPHHAPAGCMYTDPTFDGKDLASSTYFSEVYFFFLSFLLSFFLSFFLSCVQVHTLRRAHIQRKVAQLPTLAKL